MFATLLKQHQKDQDELKAEINIKRVAAERAVDNLTSNSIKDLNDGVAKAYMNQHKLDNQSRRLQANVSKLTKQAQQWMIVCNNLNSAVKDLGDITTWVQTLENDVKFIAKSVDECYRTRENNQPDSSTNQTSE